ncbi:MAG: DUF2191 domain-containing protein [Deltaproteobacteria bacterium]|nr:DUF2191 domain-containing protein [Deltaproteobacteria bacterium]
MRTTVDLADHLLVRAKQLAAAQRTTLTAILEDSLRMYLATVPAEMRKKRGRFRLPVADGGKPRAGIDLTDTSALMEIP